jgi:hypothetical protein
MFNSSNHRIEAALAIAALEREYGITAVGKARAELLMNERKYVGTARQGSRVGCRALRLLGWTERELDVLWEFESDAEQVYAMHYGNLIS